MQQAKWLVQQPLRACRVASASVRHALTRRDITMQDQLVPSSTTAYHRTMCVARQLSGTHTARRAARTGRAQLRSSACRRQRCVPPCRALRGRRDTCAADVRHRGSGVCVKPSLACKMRHTDTVGENLFSRRRRGSSSAFLKFQVYVIQIVRHLLGRHRCHGFLGLSNRNGMAKLQSPANCVLCKTCTETLSAPRMPATRYGGVLDDGMATLPGRAPDGGC
jgi:hypothetical protein